VVDFKENISFSACVNIAYRKL